MFHHAYDGYLKYAYPYDELRPLSCDGHDTWGRCEGFIMILLYFIVILCIHLILLLQYCIDIRERYLSANDTDAFW